MGKSQWEDAADGSSKRRSESSQKADKEGKKKKKKKRSVQDHTEAAVAGDAEPAAAAAVVPPAADGMQPDREPEEALDAAAGSHDADAPNSQQEGGKAGAAAASAQAAVAGAVAGGGKPAPVLPWMRVPVAIDAADGTPLDQVRGMDPRLRAALQAAGIEALFPVQTVVWRETAGGASAAHDVCLCAPTGSGKTLAYCLPLLAALAGRSQPLLRALAVLPTRDLAAQVFGVLRTLCPALGLTAALAAGKASATAEAELLSGGGIDILVATPGRLAAHLESTPGFSLASLRFLVVDETDRLLRQAYQGWLAKALAAMHRSPSRAAGHGGSGRLPSGGGSAGAGGEGGRAGVAAAAGLPEPRRVVKFVVSATLTRDPAKIDRLGLHCPRYIATSTDDHRHKLPRSLRELKLVVAAERKPAALAALLQELRGEPTIVFTSSVEATHRLHLLLRALRCLPDAVVEFSSLLPPPQRAASLEAFRSGKAKVLVCSDAMTRGMDVEGVANVVNYDAPVYVKTYVHRAGRTARAGRPGRVFTLLRHEDVRHFKAMLRKADNTFVRDHVLPKGALEAVRDDVDAALDAMAAALAAETGQGAALLEPTQRNAAAGQAWAPQQQKQRPTVRNGGDGQAGAAKRRRVAGVPEFSLLAHPPADMAPAVTPRPPTVL